MAIDMLPTVYVDDVIDYCGISRDANVLTPDQLECVRIEVQRIIQDGWSDSNSPFMRSHRTRQNERWNRLGTVAYFQDMGYDMNVNKTMRGWARHLRNDIKWLDDWMYPEKVAEALDKALDLFTPKPEPMIPEYAEEFVLHASLPGGQSFHNVYDVYYNQDNKEVFVNDKVKGKVRLEDVGVMTIHKSVMDKIGYRDYKGEIQDSPHWENIVVESYDEDPECAEKLVRVSFKHPVSVWKQDDVNEVQVYYHPGQTLPDFTKEFKLHAYEDDCSREGECPVCGSSIDYGTSDYEDDFVTFDVWCVNPDCGWEGKEDYETVFYGHTGDDGREWLPCKTPREPEPKIPGSTKKFQLHTDSYGAGKLQSFNEDFFKNYPIKWYDNTGIIKIGRNRVAEISLSRIGCGPIMSDGFSGYGVKVISMTYGPITEINFCFRDYLIPEGKPYTVFYRDNEGKMDWWGDKPHPDSILTMAQEIINYVNIFAESDISEHVKEFKLHADVLRASPVE